MIEALVVDLDDTLYLERDYVRSGFSFVARRLEDIGLVDAPTAFDHLWSEFEGGRRGDAFDSLARRFDFNARASVPDLVALYRAHRPTITLLEPDTLETLVTGGLLVGLISDGPVETQMRKIEALGLAATFDVMVLTDNWGRDFWKPHPRAFEAVESFLGVPADHLAYVADNPRKDFIAPNRRGWTSIRLRVQGQLHYEVEATGYEARPQIELSSLTRLAEQLGLRAEAGESGS